jgi:hypothetical protein
MKKNTELKTAHIMSYIVISSIVSILSIGLCLRSCSNDKKVDPQTENNIKVSLDWLINECSESFTAYELIFQGLDFIIMKVEDEKEISMARSSLKRNLKDSYKEYKELLIAKEKKFMHKNEYWYYLIYQRYSPKKIKIEKGHLEIIHR